MAETPNQRLNYEPRGAATRFESNKYATAGLSYPSDLMSPNNPYGNNYVVFYINVHEDSMLTKESGRGGFVPPSNVAPSQRGVVAGTAVSEGAVTALGAAAGASAAKTADIAGKATGFLGATLKDTVKTPTNLALGGLAGAAAVYVVGGANKQYKRQRKAIALYMPNELSVKYGVNWQETDLAGTLALGMGAENIGKVLGSIATGTSPTEAARGLKQGTSGYLAGIAMKTPGPGELLSKTSATALNPKKEQIFKDVDFRTFSFNYQFFPRSKKEAQDIQEIIKEFKLHMHPEFKPDTGQFLYIYPSEFDIFYYNNGKENLNIHRHTSCVLTDMSVLYSPQGQFTSFDDGMPSQVNISLTFRELAILTKENIKDGF